MPQVKYSGKAVTYGQKEQRPALIPLPDAKLKYAYLPDKVRNTVFRLIDKSALIDGRPLTEHDLDRSKAKVDVERLKKIDRVVNTARKAGTAGGYTDEEKKTVDAFMRDFPGKFKSFNDALVAHRKARETKDLTLGEEFKKGEADIAESVSSFVRPILATQPGGGFLADVAGATAALPVSILEGIEFFTDPNYRAKVNPQGTSGGDYAGAALKLWLNVGAPGAGRIIAPVGKAIGKGVENAGVKLVESGSLLGKPILQAKLAKEIDALEFGRELVRHGVPAKEASRAAYFATKAFQQASAEDLDLAFSRYKIEQKALPGVEDSQLALPQPKRASGAGFLAKAARAAGPEDVGETVDLVGMAKRVTLNDYIKQNWKVNAELIASDLRTIKKNTPHRNKAIALAKEIERDVKKGRVHPFVREALEEEYKAGLPKMDAGTKVPSAGQRPYRQPSNVQEIPPGGRATQSEFTAETAASPESKLRAWQAAQRIRPEQGPKWGDDLGTPANTKVDRPLSEAPIKGTQESTPTQTPLEGQKPVTGQPGAKEADATGLANQVQEREALQGVISDVEKSVGKGAEDWQGVGKKIVDEADDPDGYVDSLARKVGSGDEELTGEAVGALLEGKRRKLNRISALTERLKADPKNKALKEQLSNAERDLDEYLTNVQAGKGRWSDVGRALQAGTTYNEGAFADVLEKAKSNASTVGEKVSRGVEKDLAEKSARVKELDQKIAEKEAQLKKAPAERRLQETKAKRFDREAIRKERTEILSEIDEILKRPAGSAVGSGLGGIDPKAVQNLAALAKPVGKLALNFAKEGAATIEDVVAAVQKALAARGIQVDDQFIIDSFAEPSKTKVVADAEKELARLRSQARSESTVGKMRLKSRIAELEKIAESGKPPAIVRAEKQISQELEDLRAQRDLWAGKVRSVVESQKTPKLTRGVRELFGTLRQIRLGSDIGVLTRQGLFLWNPKRIPVALKSVEKSVLAAFSEKNFARWARDLENHKLANGRSAGAFYKKHGLSIADSITKHEEIVATRLISKIFDIPPKVMARMGMKKSADVVRQYTSAIGGSLERMQTVFINTARTEMFDRAVKLGYDESELKNMARFINNVTGRGNLKQVATAAEVIFTSPRYEASRWGTIGEMFRQPTRLLKGAAKGKLDRSSLSAIGDFAATAGTVYSVMKGAELAGYEVDWNPNSADFLKLRRGDEVWDITAGIAPRLRDAVRLIVNSRSPDYKDNALDVLSKATIRTVSPGVRTPYTEITQFGKEKKTDPFSGFEIPEDEQGWRAFAPLILNAYEQSAEADGPESGFKSAYKEFIGGGVNRYPKREYPTPLEVLQDKSSTGQSSAGRAGRSGR